ncbi:uncharacterized protein LOC111367002 [Olea europaea var. sylvestris]|uniref:uncharacterized protein LOC111367002 n=1 Tax=Olea europaea var. sylvestris TaxID=158386 RepID=UPI000C1CD8CD|nr:uncharacterized protein LOC111367002 [Olea europaea var. sylvestris]
MSLSKNSLESMHNLLKKGDKYVNTKEAKKHIKELEWPKPMLTPSSKRNQSKYYHFQKDHGHDTEECLQLKKEIEHLLRRGLLAKYLKNDRGKQRLEDRPPPRVRVIKMIIGGVASGDDSNFAGKSYSRSVGVCSIQKKARFNQSITFDEKDLIGITHLYDDALVIVGDIADFDVKRVLVDGGSAANVLTWNAFLGLKIPPEKLTMVTTPLQGFGGATVISEGTVELPVTLDTYPATMVIVTNFLVVKTPWPTMPSMASYC